MTNFTAWMLAYGLGFIYLVQAIMPPNGQTKTLMPAESWLSARSIRIGLGVGLLIGELRLGEPLPGVMLALYLCMVGAATQRAAFTNQSLASARVLVLFVTFLQVGAILFALAGKLGWIENKQTVGLLLGAAAPWSWIALAIHSCFTQRRFWLSWAVGLSAIIGFCCQLGRSEIYPAPFLLIALGWPEFSKLVDTDKPSGDTST